MVAMFVFVVVSLLLLFLRGIFTRREFFVPARTKLGLKLLMELPLY